uniref:Adenylate cyclase n=1 Tax=uncultured bacterium F41-01 TaxID=1191437 RepID=I3VIP9_9BACT|nr:adenylate cyclase [uncultured bacterium F41-01]
MVERVTGGKALPAEVVHHIASKTDGVPLFVEELTKMVVESGLLREVKGDYELSGPLPPLAIPSTLHDSLMARLDRLATVREIAQVGATIGREFDYALLQAVSPLNEDTLQRGLKQLVEAELVYQSGVPPQARYLFKHALVQDTAYQSLLRSRRQQLHEQVAQVLTEQFSDIVATQPELVAHHYTAAGLIVQAIPYWQQAGQRASQRGANAEAVSHLTTGLELLKTLPNTPVRTQHELTLQLALGALFMATHGFAAPEVEQAYRRARALCEQTGDREQAFTALFGLVTYYAMRAQHQTACELADQLLDIAQEVQASGLLIAAHYVQGSTRLWMGEFLTARAHLEQGMALYDPQQHRTLTFRYGRDLGVACRLLAHQVLWILGYPDQALTRAQEALALAQEFSHVNTLGYGLACLPQIHYNRGEWKAAQARAEACVAFATEVGLPYFVAQMTIFWGAALAAQGHYEEGIAKMRQGLAAQRATGGQGLQQLWLALQVEAYIETGQIEEGWTALEEALTIRPKHGDRYWEADLYRLKGALTLQQSKVQGSKSKVADPRPLAPDPFRGRDLKVLRKIRARTGMARRGHNGILGYYDTFQRVGGTPCLATRQCINGQQCSLPTCRT